VGLFGKEEEDSTPERAYFMTRKEQYLDQLRHSERTSPAVGRFQPKFFR
jgi:hypothetical protein